MDFSGDVVGHVAHLLIGRQAFARCFEVDVVDVSARAVGHHGHKGRELFGAGLKAFEGLAIEAVIIGGDVPLAHPADVMQGVRGENGDHPAPGFAHGKDGNSRIRRAGGLHQICTPSGRVHFHPVHFSKRAGRDSAFAHKPAPVEHVFRNLHRAKSDLRGSEGCDGAPHSVGDSRRETQPNSTNIQRLDR